MRYMDIVFLQNAEDFDEVYDVGFEAQQAGESGEEAMTAYLAQWDYGDSAGEIRTECVLAKGYDFTYENEHYVMKWSNVFGWAALWRKVPD